MVSYRPVIRTIHNLQSLAVFKLDSTVEIKSKRGRFTDACSLGGVRRNYANKQTDMLQTQNRTCSIDTPAVAQPSCTALQIALVDLLAGWGIVATAVAGHSSGEIAAAYCAGSLSHESALKIAYYRGELATRLADRKSSPRAMISVALSEEAVAPYLEEVMNLQGAGKITVGCVNSPTNVTVTGMSVFIHLVTILAIS